jgi:hypothetical protein
MSLYGNLECHALRGLCKMQRPAAANGKDRFKMRRAASITKPPGKRRHTPGAAAATLPIYQRMAGHESTPIRDGCEAA